jgi:hypothetical protein
MDVTALLLHGATCYTNESQCELFDSVFQHYVAGDEGGFYHKAPDLVVGNGTMPPVAIAIVYGMLFPASHFGEDDNLEMLLALSVALLANNVWGVVIERAVIELAFSYKFPQTSRLILNFLQDEFFCLFKASKFIVGGFDSGC